MLVLSCSPGLPSWTTFSSPGSKESSYSIIVSIGSSFFSVNSWLPSVVPLPTWIRASSASTLSTLGSPTTWESLIVHVVVIVPTLPGFTILYSPGLRSSDSSTLYPNGISSSCFTSPSVFLPTLIILSLGALVWVNSPSWVFVTSPSWIVRVMSLLFLPSSPSWTTFCSPGFRESSNSIFVSNGTSTSSVILWVPSLTPSPTWITRSVASFITSSFVFVSSTFESFIV